MKKNAPRDPIFKLARAIRLLRAMSPADREYALRKANEPDLYDSQTPHRAPGSGNGPAVAPAPNASSHVGVAIEEPDGKAARPRPTWQPLCRECDQPIQWDGVAGAWLRRTSGSTLCRPNEPEAGHAIPLPP